MAIKKYKPSMIAGVAVIVLVMSAFSANAIPVYEGTYVDMYLKQNTFPTDPLLEDKIYFDAAVASTITGHVGSQTDPRLVIFSSPTDTLDAKNGYAQISAFPPPPDRSLINEIIIHAPGYYFEDLIFGIQAPNDINVDFTVSATGSGWTNTYDSWTSLTDWSNGTNNILVLASEPGALIQSITIQSNYGFNEIEHVQISGLSPVPVPAAMLLLGTGLVGLVGARLRKKK